MTWYTIRPDTIQNLKWPNTRWSDTRFDPTCHDIIRNLKWPKLDDSISDLTPSNTTKNSKWLDTRWPDFRPDLIWFKTRNNQTRPDSSINRSLGAKYFSLLMVICDTYFAYCLLIWLLDKIALACVADVIGVQILRKHVDKKWWAP
jgi:hypothetical protein